MVTTGPDCDRTEDCPARLHYTDCRGGGAFRNGYNGGLAKPPFPDGLDRDENLPDIRDTL